jgi:branched-chain amino acid transport system ATP-binding protein
MSASAIEVESVVVAFGGLRALDSVSVAMESSRITGLIGPNGSGKSTLVNAISGQIPATAGTIRVGGRDVTRMRSDRIVQLGLARSFQIPRFPPQLTVEEIVAVPLIYGRGANHLLPELRTAADVAAFCGLGARRLTTCQNLTVTDMRRLEIARALACGPSVLLLDEVMAGLSHADSIEVMELVRKINRSGVTVVIIEHLMRVITTLCDDLIVLNNGKLLARGSPSVVLADDVVREAYLGKGFKA